MLDRLTLDNVALIDSVVIEFGPGLNLLTGETGSGKSMIVDSLAALSGERVSSDLVKEGTQGARIEGLFILEPEAELLSILDEAGIEREDDAAIELIVRREVSLSGKNRIFVNSRLVTAAFLKRLGKFLVDIHGQGEQSTLFEPASHLDLLDEFASTASQRERVASLYWDWRKAVNKLEELERGESEKLQLIDILRFQVDEIANTSLSVAEEGELADERRRLNNVEKLSLLSAEALELMYEADTATLSTLDKASKRVLELAEFDSRFAEYREGLESAQALLGDLAFALSEFRNHLEFSPSRLEEIENRLAEIARVTRKYGGTVEAALEHYEASRAKLDSIENAELHQEAARKLVEASRAEYEAAARELSRVRTRAAAKFGKEVEAALDQVALAKSRFEVKMQAASAEAGYTARGIDTAEFYFSANPGESVKPVSRVASGGEASRLMLILKTTAKEKRAGKAVVFDEIDAGIGGRVAEAVGQKLKVLAAKQQVLCVTHQAQVASKADRHFAVTKTVSRNRTVIDVSPLSPDERIEEVARMLAGETVTAAARENAREMIAAA